MSQMYETTRYGTDVSEPEPPSGKDISFFFSKSVQTCSGVQPACCTTSTGFLPRA